MNLKDIGLNSVVQPRATLTYESMGILVKGLIFNSSTKDLAYEDNIRVDFEYNTCMGCNYYKHKEVFLIPIDKFKEAIIRDLKYYEEDYDEDYFPLEQIKAITSIEDIQALSNSSIPYRLRVRLNDYIDHYYTYQQALELRTCEGGWSVLEKDECRRFKRDEIAESAIYKVGIPSHVWLKLSDKDDVTDYCYLLLGMINHNGIYIMPPLAIGNVWSKEQEFLGKDFLGMVCWGDVEPSSNPSTAYIEFWDSIFNYDSVGSNIELNRSEEYGYLMLSSIKNMIEEKYLPEEFINNIILEDGQLKKGVLIKKVR